MGTALFNLIVIGERIVDVGVFEVNCQVYLLISLAKIPPNGSGVCFESIIRELIKIA